MKKQKLQSNTKSPCGGRRAKAALLSAFLCLVVLSLSCNSAGDDDAGGTTLSAVQIELKGYGRGYYSYDYYEGSMGFKVTAEKISIDWGDRGKDNETDLVCHGVERTFSHDYGNTQTYQTISIDGEDLKSFGQITYNEGSPNGYWYELRFFNCPALESIDVRGDQHLSVFAINNASSLKSLTLMSSKVSSLNLRGCPALTNLKLAGNPLTSLDISNTNIEVLRNGYEYYPNDLTSLNVTNCTKLTILDCTRGQLTSLDVSGCNNLANLYCRENQLSASALNALFHTLPSTYNGGTIYISGNPGTDDCDRSIATSVGWQVVN
jgi:Leucine-rich repeat (LRR) protein